ncbi:hypothetical protein GH714_001324 [Hevea brasiliensis]|uniref:Uncharacterized protein n=1 Tax=Hevea brasiliensis TaxID=3981 RepID=A0A6A6MB84_HEVBR|nr:hypothetical protein GH714_001324 [Hevea brasiliensis]
MLRSALWEAEESESLEEFSFFFILLKGTKTIRGLILDMHLLREEKHVGPISNYGNYSHENSVEESVLGCEDNRSMHNRLGGIVWQIVNCIPKTSSTSADVIKTEAFANMRQLNVLLLDDVKLDGGYEDFPKHLVCLRWLRFPLNSMPTCLNVEKLVVLDMRYSRLKHAWQGKVSASILQNVVQLVQSDCPHLRGCFIVMNNNVWCRLECVGDGLGPRVILQENTSGPLLEGLLAQNLPLWDMHKGKLVEADKGDIFTGSLLAILRVFIESLKLNEILMEKATMRFLTMDLVCLII